MNKPRKLFSIFKFSNKILFLKTIKNYFKELLSKNNHFFFLELLFKIIAK